jgi:DNA-binding CsgD family transcriptional regulator
MSGTALGEGAERCPSDEPQYYLRQLLLAVQRDGAMSTDSERIILDVDLDGQRYLLVAMPQPDVRMAALSPREIEIARLVSLGHPNKVIAGVLEISSWTVCTHLRRMFMKLSVNSRAAMVAKLADTNPAYGRSAPSPADRHPHAARKSIIAAEVFAGLDDSLDRFEEADLPLPPIDARGPAVAMHRSLQHRAAPRVKVI